MLTIVRGIAVPGVSQLVLTSGEFCVDLSRASRRSPARSAAAVVMATGLRVLTSTCAPRQAVSFPVRSSSCWAEVGIFRAVCTGTQPWWSCPQGHGPWN